MDFLRPKLLAVKWHHNQKYGEHPYIYHLEQVVSELNSLHSRHYEIRTSVAYLHDILEDTKCPEQEILDLYPYIEERGKEPRPDTRAVEILRNVKLLSKNYSKGYEPYIEGIIGSKIARMVKIADSTCNLKNSLYNWDRDRVIKYVKQIKLLTEGGYRI